MVVAVTGCMLGHALFYQRISTHKHSYEQASTSRAKAGPDDRHKRALTHANQAGSQQLPYNAKRLPQLQQPCGRDAQQQTCTPHNHNSNTCMHAQQRHQEQQLRSLDAVRR